MTKMKKSLVLLVLVISVLLFAGCSGNPAAETEDNLVWNTYDGDSFNMKYPGSWQQMVINEETKSYGSYKVIGFGENINQLTQAFADNKITDADTGNLPCVFVFETEYTQDVTSGLWDDIVSEWNNRINNYSTAVTVETNQEILFKGKNAFKVVASGPLTPMGEEDASTVIDSIKLMGLEVVNFDNDTEYGIVYYTTQDKYQQILEIVNEMVDSFEFN